MTDLVERARHGEPCAEAGETCRSMTAKAGCFCAEVADEFERINALWVAETREIERLAAENAKLRAVVDELRTMEGIQKRDAAIERLTAALGPFVTAANDAEGYPDNHHIGCDPCMRLEGLTVGDLRRAREAEAHEQSVPVDRQAIGKMVEESQKLWIP